MIMSKLFGKVGTAVAAIAGLVALVVAFASEQRQIGGNRAVKKIEHANDAAAERGLKAAGKSAAGAGSGGVRRKRDPLTRDE